MGLRSDKQEYARLAGCLNEGNRAWAAVAPALTLVVAQVRHERGENRYAFHDTGLAVATLTLQALSHDLYVHPMGGFSVEKARETYALPDDFQPVIMLAIGYLGDPSMLSVDQAEKERLPRSRKPLGEILFHGEWGRAFIPMVEFDQD
ncbi:MAG: nitroreductase family protein [Anaerolineales bacterium]|nr:nitroreductase family protein [Anaerolineales bacterium]